MENDSLAEAWKFVIHVVIGGLQFLVLLLVTALIAGLVKAIRYLEFAPAWLVQGLEWVEWTVFWIDVLVFGLFVVAEALTLIASLWQKVRSSWSR